MTGRGKEKWSVSFVSLFRSEVLVFVLVVVATIKWEDDRGGQTTFFVTPLAALPWNWIKATESKRSEDRKQKCNICFAWDLFQKCTVSDVEFFEEMFDRCGGVQ